MKINQEKTRTRRLYLRESKVDASKSDLFFSVKTNTRVGRPPYNTGGAPWSGHIAVVARDANACSYTGLGLFVAVLGLHLIPGHR
ncbi:hypothetical protein RUM43_002257 [Polyplax serrata]|uniref:Uncharacterized protein n=1 Tax=Polyplax serrata TaxID=468196 RepID=A0AAN8PZC7_POLSC